MRESSSTARNDSEIHSTVRYGRYPDIPATRTRPPVSVGKPTNDRGITVTELLIFIAIIAVLIGILLPTVQVPVLSPNRSVGPQEMINRS